MESPSAFDRLRLEGGQAPFPGWGRLEVRGRHRERFLHSQVTSDVRGLPHGQSQLSSLLDSHGRLQAFFLVLKREESLVLLVPAELIEVVAAELGDRVIGDDVEVLELAPRRMRLMLGPEAVRLRAGLPPEEVFPVELYGERGFVTWSDVTLPLEEVGEDLLEGLRVVTGLPRWNLEVARGMLVNETSLVDTAVSFDKGCYLGQETVAKVHSHRGAAYAPMLLEVGDAVDDPSSLLGRPFRAAGRRAGVIRSSARWEGKLMLHASLLRDLRVPGTTLEVEVDGAPKLMARVVALPLVALPAREDSARALLETAVARFAADAEGEAARLLERAIAVCPTFADAWEALGVMHLRQERYEDAIELFRRLLEVDPDSVLAHTNLSLCHNRLGRVEDAEREAAAATAARMRRFVAEEERAERERRDRESALADRGRREEMLRQVLDLDPRDPLAHFGLGQLCVDAGRFEEAVEHLRAALEVEPSHSAAHLALGRAWEGLDRVEEALAVYRAGVEVAARRGDLRTATRMQERLAGLSAG